MRVPVRSAWSRNRRVAAAVALSAGLAFAGSSPASANNFSGNANCGNVIAYVFGNVTSYAGTPVQWKAPGVSTPIPQAGIGYREYDGAYSGAWSIVGNGSTITNAGAACRPYG